VGLGLFFAHHHIPVLTGSFRAACPYKAELLSLLPSPPPGDKVNLFSDAVSLFQKRGWEKTSVEKLLKCLLQSTVPFLALGVKDMPSLSISSERGGRGGGDGRK